MGAGRPIPSSLAAERGADALRGVRVLDLTSVIMGPVCTQILGGYGADVVKVEPLDGDIMRHAGARRFPGMGSMFLHANRCKRSLAVDIKTERGRQLIKRMVPRFDTVVHNMRALAVERVGLGYADLKPLRGDLIYAELVGYGPRGRYAGRPAFDDIIQAQTGLASLFTRQDGGEPRYVPALIADRMTGLAAAHRILAALYRRQSTGQGECLTVSMFETMAAFTLSDHMGGHSFVPALGATGYNRLLTPHRRPYRTRDGHIAVVVYNDKHWRAFFEVTGRPEAYGDDDRFSSAERRAQSYDFIYGFLAGVLAEETTAHWLERLGAADIPCAPVNTVEDLINDPHLRDAGFFSVTEDPMGASRAFGPGAGAGGTPSPRTGEHSRDVLAAEGIAAEEIEDLIAAGVVGVAP